ncbi:MAG: EamA family transporter [Lachnospiraceae bacterium]|nr:EamA family transporter [Lachnospiraceae bacterium]
MNIGPILVFLSGVCFSLGGIFIKYIPWSPLAINAARNAIAFLFVFAYLKITKHKIIFNKTVLIGALAISVTQGLYCIANKLTTAGNAIILQFTVPIWVMIISAVFFKKKPKSLDIWAAVVVMIGVLFFFIDGLQAGNMLGNALALISGITYSGVFLMNATPESDSLSSTFFGMILNVLIGLPWLIKTDFAATESITWIVIIVMGIVQVACAFILLATGLKTTSPIAASLISGVEPVLNPIWVAIFYGEMLTPLSLIGAVMVLVAVLIYNTLLVKKAK